MEDDLPVGLKVEDRRSLLDFDERRSHSLFCIIWKNMQDTAEYICAFCGESNSTFVDFSAGLTQSYVEDCQVCCQPNQGNRTRFLTF